MSLITKNSSRWPILLFGVVAIGLALRLAAIGAFTHTPESDEVAYLSMALNLISGNGIVDDAGNRAFYNVGYPLLVLSPVFAIFGDNILVARLSNALLSSLTIVLCYATAREAGAGKTGSLLAAALWAVYLPASVYTVYLFKENLMAPLMLGVVWCAIRFVKEPDYIIGAGCGVLFGLIALSGNAGLALAAPVMGALAFSPAALKQKLLLLLSIFITALLITSPWLFRNLQVLGVAVLNTNGGFNFYLGNNPAATGMFVSIADTPRGDTWQELHNKGEVIASETVKQEAITWIKEQPSSFLALALKKAVLFWTPPYHEGTGQASKQETAARIVWLIQFSLLIAGATASIFIRPLWTSSTVVFWLAIASYTAVHMIFYVIFRYREPLMPLLCVLAAITFEALWKLRKVRRDVSQAA